MYTTFERASQRVNTNWSSLSNKGAVLLLLGTRPTLLIKDEAYYSSELKLLTGLTHKEIAGGVDNCQHHNTNTVGGVYKTIVLFINMLFWNLLWYWMTNKVPIAFELTTTILSIYCMGYIADWSTLSTDRSIELCVEDSTLMLNWNVICKLKL